MEATELNLQRINKFVKHCAKELGLSGEINIVLIEGQGTGMPTAGFFDLNDKSIHVAIRNRAMADCLRTIAHEMTHLKQAIIDNVDFPTDDAGLQPYEDSANTTSGYIVRYWGRDNKYIYEDLI